MKKNGVEEWIWTTSDKCGLYEDHFWCGNTPFGGVEGKASNRTIWRICVALGGGKGRKWDLDSKADAQPKIDCSSAGGLG